MDEERPVFHQPAKPDTIPLPDIRSALLFPNIHNTSQDSNGTFAQEMDKLQQSRAKPKKNQRSIYEKYSKMIGAKTNEKVIVIFFQYM